MTGEQDEPATLELPPLDLDEPQDEGPADDFEHALEVDERSAIDGDDEPALDLEIGMELSDGAEPSTDPGGDLVLDIGELLEKSDDEGEDEDRGTLGPEHFDMTSGLGEVPDEPASSSAVEGTDEPLDDLVSEELPELDADEEGVGGVDPADLVSLELRYDDHEAAPWAEERWSPVSSPVATPLNDVAIQDGRVLAAGDGVWIIGDGGADVAHHELDGTHVTTLALIQPEPPVVLCATRDSRLVLAEIGPGQTASWNELDAPGDGAPVELATADHAVLAKSATGKLFCTRDSGKSWQLVDVGSRFLALARRGTPLVALAHGRGRPCLLRSNDAGRSWRQDALDEAARSVALGQSPLLAAGGSVVALADARLGMVISDDGGASFRVVAHSFGATALAAGVWAGRPHVWAALLGDLDGVARLVLVDPQTAQAITLAELGSEEQGDSFRVDALAWDAWGSRVWAGGAFGLLSFAPRRPH